VTGGDVTTRPRRQGQAEITLREKNVFPPNGALMYIVVINIVIHLKKYIIVT
jgi:hypothetical protein